MPIVVGVFCCSSYEGRRILASTIAAAVVIVMGVKSLEEDGIERLKNLFVLGNS